MRIIHAVFLLILLLPVSARAAPGEVTLYAPAALEESGLLAYALPRFKLKTQIRVVLVGAPGTAEVAFVTDGSAPPLIKGPGGTYGARLADKAAADSPAAARLVDWLYSEVGQRTLAAFQKDGAPIFALVFHKAAPEAAPLPEGDVARGKRLAYRNCGRCHVVGPDNRMAGIGSTPSFGVLRSLPDWRARFTTYYLRPPHPGFTQIEGLTPPFNPAHPPSLVPLTLSLDGFNALLAFAARVPPADLGAPLQTR